MGNETQAIMCTPNNTRISYILTEDMIELYKEMKEQKINIWKTRILGFEKR